MKRRLLPMLVALALAPVVSHSQSAPPVINYQGRLTQSTGVVVPDGLTGMRVRIFATASGGTAIWDSGDLSVATKSGTFSILLGSGGMLPMSPLVFALGTVYIEVQPSGQQPLLPRQPIASVPWSLYAQTVSDGAITPAKVAFPFAYTTSTAGELSRLFSLTNTGAGYTIYGESRVSPAVAGYNTGNAGGAGVVGSSSSGIGVIGTSDGPSSYGVLGQSTSTGGYGIYGRATNGYGVQGINLANNNYGVLGSSSDGVYGKHNASGNFGSLGSESVGVYGFAVGTKFGGFFENLSPSGRGVFGASYGTSGVTYGGWFETYSPDGRSVYGKALATTGTNYGVFGETASAIGVGVYGMATAQSSQTHGVYGDAYGKGVAGNSNGASGYGVYATNDAGGTGIYARGTSPGYAGIFQGNVRTNGSSAVFGDFDAHGPFNTDDPTPTKPGPGDTWTVPSDARLKKNINPLDDSLSKLLALRGVSYEYRDPKRGAGRYPGFIAQDVQKVFPDWVTVGDDGYLRVGPIGFEASAVEAMRELEARISRAQRENAELKLESSKLRSRVGELAVLNETLTARVARMERLLTQISSVAPTRKNVK